MLKPRFAVVVSHPYEHRQDYWTFVGAWNHAQHKPRNSTVSIIDLRSGDVLWICRTTCSHHEEAK